MASVHSLPANAANAYDYIIVGGGTAGCVMASRLSSYLPEKKVLMIEAGPSDLDLGNVLDLRQWLTLLGGDLDYDYGTTEQPMGNSHIRHSRAKVLGGCSSHNTLISFRPFRHDLDRWVANGCEGWDFETLMRLVDNLRNTIQPVHARHRNQLCKDWVLSTSEALSIPVIPDFNKQIADKGQLNQGVGFFSVSYNPDNGHRSSASVAYIHPILKGEERRPNLTVLTEAHVSKLHVENDVASGIDVTLKSGQKLHLSAKKEIILSAGAVDTPRLLLHSGIGPRKQLEALGIPVVKDLPGVGENLLDHPETIIMWQLNKPVPENQTTMDSDAGVFLRREIKDAAGNDGEAADIMMHCYQIPFTLNTGRLGYPEVKQRYAFCMTPNIPRPRSRGRIYLTSNDPAVKPALDFRYFTDPEGYDAATFVAGIKAARKIAQQAPFADWLDKEVAPGPKVQTDEEISEYARRVAHTVYHPAGTTKMGAANDDAAVVDPKLKVRGIGGLRIADAGVFPDMPSINPMVTVLAIGERAAELIAMEEGWKPDTKPRL
ncbi:Choline oxidase-like protein [Emericellopsis cladophorae]|uniref:Choline oxidase-like protein n=1 Tax=Emericellopsis cladophorae TaxID=2686198 RepID=A0A9P9XVF6_9HYPO|nr:Choline oxidase-like protein [Emericellopsis cladophorae]KAI6778557.1 Choline oxidase-like protein [Emericellopsis cladophorae]